MLGVKRKKEEKEVILGTVKITDQMKKEYLEKKQVRDFLTAIPHLKLKEIKQHKKQKTTIPLVEKTNMEKEPVVLWEKTTNTVSDLVAKEMISVIKSLSFNDYVSVIVLLNGKPILFPGKFKGMNGDTFLLVLFFFVYLHCN